jgi:hypothetical protein
LPVGLNPKVMIGKSIPSYLMKDGEPVYVRMGYRTIGRMSPSRHRRGRSSLPDGGSQFRLQLGLVGFALALFVVPHDFSRDLLRGRPQVQLLAEPVRAGRTGE